MTTSHPPAANKPLWALVTVLAGALVVLTYLLVDEKAARELEARRNELEARSIAAVVDEEVHFAVVAEALDAHRAALGDDHPELAVFLVKHYALADLIHGSLPTAPKSRSRCAARSTGLAVPLGHLQTQHALSERTAPGPPRGMRGATSRLGVHQVRADVQVALTAQSPAENRG